MVIIPWVGVAAAVRQWRIMGGLPVTGLLQLLFLGILWGVAALLYGLAVDMLGVALGFSILTGLSIVIGAVVPRFMAGTLLAAPARDVAFFAGLLLMVLGVII